MAGPIWQVVARHRVGLVLAGVVAALLAFLAMSSSAGPDAWRSEFPKTDFAKTVIEFAEITDDGNTRDSIPPVFEPVYLPAAEVTDVGPLEPVLSIGINGDFRAYPLRILLWHEIVNEVIGGVPVLVSYCPLCNSGVVFDRRLGDRTLEFGNTGRIRHMDMVMYDHATESWWQQFTGEAIIGELAGQLLTVLPARLESLQKFRARARRQAPGAIERACAALWHEPVSGHGHAVRAAVDGATGGFPAICRTASDRWSA